MEPVRPTRPITHEHVLETAVRLADRDGLAALSMRALARELGVEAMSLYHHVAGKEALLDGMVDLVFTEFHLPRAGRDWAEEMRLRATSARRSLLRHPWAIGLMDSRKNPGLATLRHHDAVIGCLRAAGFSVQLTAHAFALLDAHLYGHVLQEVALPIRPDGSDLPEVAERMFRSTPVSELPHLVEMAAEHVTRVGYSFGAEMSWGLELVLGGLAAARDMESQANMGGTTSGSPPI